MPAVVYGETLSNTLPAAVQSDFWPTLSSCYQPVERYVNWLKAAGETIPPVPVRAIDTFLMRKIAAYSTRSLVQVDFAAEATLGASTLLWATEPGVRRVLAPQISWLPERPTDWRPLFLSFVDEQSREGLALCPEIDIHHSGRGEALRQACPLALPVQLTLALPEAMVASLADCLRWLFTLWPQATLYFFPLGPIGQSQLLEAALAFCSETEDYRLTALREISPFLGASQLGLIYPRNDSSLPLALERLAQLYEGNFQFLMLAEAVISSALREQQACEEIARTNEEVARQQAACEELSRMLAARDLTIQELNRSSALREQQTCEEIARTNEEVARQQAACEELNRLLVARDLTIEELTLLTRTPRLTRALVPTVLPSLKRVLKILLRR